MMTKDHANAIIFAYRYDNLTILESLFKQMIGDIAIMRNPWPIFSIAALSGAACLIYDHFFSPFSFLPVILQFWEGDEEFPANLKFMFDENILQYIHYETIFYLLEHVTGRIQETMVMGKNEFGGRNLYTNK